MPKFLGTRAKQKATAAGQEQALLTALQVAGPEEIPTLVADLVTARADKQAAAEAPESEFTCAWHRDPKKNKDGVFQGRGRVVFEVTGAWLYENDDEIPEFEWKDRFEPRYFVGCLSCNQTFGLLDHLME